MSRPFALLVCLPVIWWLWKRDQQARPAFSKALWIPQVWLLLLGSRPLSWWLGVGSSGGTNLEGNSFDRIFYLILIFASLNVVSKRQLNWPLFIRQNAPIFLFYAFLLSTLLWSPYAFVSFKRWFKDIGAIAVILVILTEHDPLEATRAVFARCAYVWFPLSEIFAKYFPGIGREYSKGGFATYTGVTTQKNSLGEIVLVVGLVLLSELARPNRPLKAGFLKGHHLTISIALAMGMWLLFLCDSKTSTICFAVGAFIVLSHKIPVLKSSPRRVLIACLLITTTYFVSQSLYNVSDQLLGLVGRDSTLTQRTEIWEAIKENPVNPVIGCGYMMYWEINKGGVGDEDQFFDVKTAHNGYLEIYLDGGIAGVVFLGIMLFWLGARVTRKFLQGLEFDRLALAFFIVMLLYNVSESMFARRSVLWFSFLLFTLELRHCLPSRANRGTDVPEDWRVDDRELVGAG